MESEEPGGAAALSWTDSGWPDARGIPAADSAAAVAALYQNHAVGLIRLAYLMLGDRAGAEDAVQDAFSGTGRVSLRALPTAFIPANAEVRDMGLSPDGTSLAADIDSQGLAGSHLFVFDLPTGNEREWSFKTCAGCGSSSGGLGYGGTNVDALSWTGDGRHVAFVGPNRAGWPSHSTVRLLDVTLPGSDLLANSRPVAEPPPGDQLNDVSWRGAIITPDGRTVVIVEELASDSAPIKVRDRLLKVSVATGRVTVVNDLNILAGYQYEQVMYTNATGSVLVVSGARKGMTAGILRGDRYTPIPWDRHIATAIW